MLIVRAPTRITLGGGGTDLPEFYEQYGGFWINATINKYVYVATGRRFEKELKLSYSLQEEIYGSDTIKHPLIREVFKHFHVNAHVEMNSFADLPAQTGLGSSGAYTVGLIKNLSTRHHEDMTPEDIAELAYDIERERLNRPIGKQDQYSAVFGGMRFYSCNKKGNVISKAIPIPELEDKLMLIYTGKIRDSTTILDKVKTSTEQLLKIKKIGLDSLDALLNREYTYFGELMKLHWEVKRSIAPEMSTEPINKLYDKCIRMGACGGKLVGAGSGGFILLVVPNDEVRREIQKMFLPEGMEIVDFSLTYQGSEVMDW